MFFTNRFCWFLGNASEKCPMMQKFTSVERFRRLHPGGFRSSPEHRVHPRTHSYTCTHVSLAPVMFGGFRMIAIGVWTANDARSYEIWGLFFLGLYCFVCRRRVVCLIPAFLYSVYVHMQEWSRGGYFGFAAHIISPCVYLSLFHHVVAGSCLHFAFLIWFSCQSTFFLNRVSGIVLEVGKFISCIHFLHFIGFLFPSGVSLEVEIFSIFMRRVLEGDQFSRLMQRRPSVCALSCSLSFFCPMMENSETLSGCMVTIHY